MSPTAASARSGPTARLQDLGAHRAGGARGSRSPPAAGPAAGGLGLLLHGPHRRLLHGDGHPAGAAASATGPARASGSTSPAPRRALTLTGTDILDLEVNERAPAAARAGRPQPQRACRPWPRTASIPAAARTPGWRWPAGTTPTGRPAGGDRRARGRAPPTLRDSKAGWRTRTSSTAIRPPGPQPGQVRSGAADARGRRAGFGGAKPEERVDHDADTAEWGLWPTVTTP